MAINKKLIHFLNKTNFLEKLNGGEILDTSIVFIRDAKQIWTHGELYSCPYTEEEINLLFIGSNIKLTGYTEIDSPVEILATDTVNQAFGKIEDYLKELDLLNAVLVDTGEAAFDPIINDYISSTQLANELLKYVTDLKLASKGYITAAQVPNPDLSNYITKVDSKNYTDTAIANLVDSAPETLNTLNELAAALKDNADIVDVLNESISSKLSKTEAEENYATKADLETISIKWSILEKSELYEWIDLGLPSGLKWAAWNVGASKPEDFGLYFAWGETEGYEGITDEKQFIWADYKLCGGSSSTLTKYNNDSSYGTVDTLTTLEQVDDAAYQSDNTCRMPTKDECQELIDNTTSTWETLNDVNGRRFTSNTNGKSIFVPAAGICNYGSVYDVGSSGFLLSSSLNESSPGHGWGLGFDSSGVYVTKGNRYYGLSVRAVKS